MNPITVEQLANIVGGELHGTSPDTIVQHASTHSDRIRSSSIFFALPGRNHDGHDYVDRAITNGAVLAVVAASQFERVSRAEHLVVVDDVLHALQLLAAWWRSQLLTTTVVAVVGNIGKTVTKDALVQFLSCSGPTYGSPGSYNSQVGVPLALLECPADATFAVIEAASSEPAEIARLADIIAPTHVVITNTGTRFLANFGSLDRQADELVQMARDLPNTSWVLVGDDAPELRQAVRGLAARVYSMADPVALPAFAALDYQAESVSTTVRFPDGSHGGLTVQTPSEFVLHDVCLALSAAWLLGVGSPDLLEAVNDYVPTSARMEVWRSPSGVTLVRDIATADGATFGSAILVANRIAAAHQGRTIVVLADSYSQCRPDEAVALGKTIGRSRVSELYTLDSEVHRRIASGFGAVSPHLTALEFDSLPSLRRHLISSEAGARSGDVVLIEAPRARTMSDLSTSLIEPMALTRLYIDESCIGQNVAAIRRLIGPDVQLMAMVKALGYGTDPVQLSLCLVEAGVDALATATVDEAVAIRKGGISIETILVTLATDNDFDRMSRYRITPLIYSAEMLDAAVRFAKESDRELKVHLEVDTGMHRTGLAPADALAGLHRLAATPSIQLTGLMTHFACADDASMDAMTLRQLKDLNAVVAGARDIGFDNFSRHAANTAATLRLDDTRLDMVRVGIGILGIYPSVDTTSTVELAPVASLVSQIVEIRDIPPGDTVGYGATFESSPLGSRIGVVAAGYHDCIPRSFSNRGSVVVNGTTCPVVGRVSMDSMTIDLTNCPDATVGSDVLIFGRHSNSYVSIEKLALEFDTIPYELLAGLGPRVQRVFTQH